MHIGWHALSLRRACGRRARASHPCSERATRRSQIARACEDGVEHGLGEPAGKRVLLTGMVAAQKKVRTDADLCSVAEPGPTFRYVADPAQHAQDPVPREPPKANDQPNAT